MKSDLRWAIEAHRHDGGTGTHRGVAKQVEIFPGPGAHVSGKLGIECEWDATWQANLPAMGMAADQHGEAHVSGLLVDFGAVRKQDGKFATRDTIRYLLDTCDLIEVGIVNAGEVYASLPRSRTTCSLSNIRIPISSKAGTMAAASWLPSTP